VFVRSAACSTTGKFAVNHDGRHAADTVPLGLGSNFGLLHIVDDYLVRRPASRLTRSIVSLQVEQPALNTSIFFFVAIGCFYLLFIEFIKLLLWDIRGTLLSRGMSESGQAFHNEAITRSPSPLQTIRLDSNTNLPRRTAPPPRNPRRKGPYPRRLFALNTSAAKARRRNRTVSGNR
jgi:hypothetical protein